MADDSSAPTTDPHSSATPPVAPTGAEADAPRNATHAPEPPAPGPAEPLVQAPATAPYPDIAATAAESDTPALVPARSEPQSQPPLAAAAPKHEDESDKAAPSRPAPAKPPPPVEPPSPPPPENKKRWYVVKVQSGREDTIKEAIERRVRKDGLEEFYGQIVIPVEKVTEVKTDKNGKRVTRTKERKLYPGYLMC
jgi:transcriptional antiterminator NusG